MTSHQYLTFPVNTSCGINKLCNTVKQAQLWLKLHNKKCDTCKDEKIYQSYETVRIKEKSMKDDIKTKEKIKNNYQKFNKTQYDKDLISLLQKDENRDKYFKLQELIKITENENLKKELLNEQFKILNEIERKYAALYFDDKEYSKYF